MIVAGSRRTQGPCSLHPLTGQACNCAERVYVQEGIAPQFIEKIVARFKKATWGDAPAGTFDMGPLVNRAQQEHVDELVRDAVRNGGKVECGGVKAQVGGKGYFYEPTVITGCTHDMRIMREEIFGPVLPITTFRRWTRPSRRRTTAFTA